MNKIVSKIVEASIFCGVIKEEDRKLYAIAISSLGFSFFTWSSLILCGIIFGNVYGCLIFLIFHIPLRIYAGGYHQSTRKKCYIQSLIIFGLLMFGAFSAVKTWVVISWKLIAAFSFITIWIFAPVEALNKPLNSKERRHHKITARIILVIEAMVLILFMTYQFETGLYYAIMSIFLVAIQLILGILEQRFRK